MTTQTQPVIFISNAVLSFPHLIEPHSSIQGGQKKYSADFIVPQNDPGFVAFMQRYQQLAVEKWGENAGAVMQMIQSDRKLRAYGSGDEKIDKKTFKPYSGYAGNVYITANNDNRPQMIQANGQPADPSNEMLCQQMARKLYGGCYVHVALKPWVQDNSFGRGIRCELIAVQFAKDGTPFGESTPDVTNLFGAVAQQAGPSAAGANPVPGMPSFLNPF